MLHAVTASSRAAGVPRGGHAPNGWDLLAEIIKGAEKQREHTLAQDLVGLTIQRSLVNGDAAEAIMEAATQQNADLIMMPSHGSSFDQFLMGSVTTKVLSETNCPVWTGAHLKESHSKKFALRSILCAVDFRPHNRKTVTWAKQLAEEFGAQPHACERHGRRGVLGAGRRLRQSSVGKGTRWRCHRAYGGPAARDGHQGRRFYWQRRRSKGAQPSCKAGRGRLAGYRLPTLRRLSENARLRSHLRNGHSSSECLSCSIGCTRSFRFVMRSEI